MFVTVRGKERLLTLSLSGIYLILINESKRTERVSGVLIGSANTQQTRAPSYGNTFISCRVLIFDFICRAQKILYTAIKRSCVSTDCEITATQFVSPM